MSEMDLLKRIEALESKVSELENTLNTIGMMEKSERITEYLQNRRRNQKSAIKKPKTKKGWQRSKNS